MGVALTGVSACRRWVKPSFPDSPFALGVASGDPSSDGMVLWTRVAPAPMDPGGGMPDESVDVTWELAEDDGFSRVLQSGAVLASPELGHSVHVEIDGLTPDRWYWYRFHVGEEVSPVGRTRTMPPVDASPDRLRFVFASCQHYEQGLFTAHEHLAREDVDLVFFLGDYIYEYEGIGGRVRKHFGREISSVHDYRARYSQYRSDELLRNAHAAFPWVVTSDDHEVDNDYAGDIDENGGSGEQFLSRRANAYQVYYEMMPVRASAMPTGPDMTLYRDMAFGRLARFFVLDTRQYRSNQTCGDCADMDDPSRTMLGDEQEAWLNDGFDRTSARWNVLAQQIPVATDDRDPGPARDYSADKWGGYPVAQRRLLNTLVDRAVSNPVVLTGDVHSNHVYDLRLDFDDDDAPAIGTEYVGTSLSSSGDGEDRPERRAELMRNQPYRRWYNGQRGYVRCEVTPERWTSEYRVVPYVTRPGSPVETAATFVTENGRPGAVAG
jgi:alkaline phosphatase D